MADGQGVCRLLLLRAEPESRDVSDHNHILRRVRRGPSRLLSVNRFSYRKLYHQFKRCADDQAEDSQPPNKPHALCPQWLHWRCDGNSMLKENPFDARRPPRYEPHPQRLSRATNVWRGFVEPEFVLLRNIPAPDNLPKLRPWISRPQHHRAAIRVTLNRK